MRIRWPFTILWTVLCAYWIAGAFDAATKPVSPDCFEYCGFDASLSQLLIGGIVVVWLTVIFAASWLWTRATNVRCPRCRRWIDADARVCPKCSYDVAQGVDAPVAADDEAADDEAADGPAAAPD
jgi:hypothetical protein